MAEKSSEIIKFLFNMKVVATINHNIDKDTAEYIVKNLVIIQSEKNHQRE